ncbi:Uncharacterized protein dnm_041430 [Desulfonema magnum]|uniref:Uncharacterized protein n=1 Tax=Desulfonema magnum TaxID=45655 RepID=A0A975BM59_9BACT|nr:Uncharacterized protein dnm_041430 [Desulfonema magnum]
MQKFYFCACEKAFFALRRKHRKARLRLSQQYWGLVRASNWGDENVTNRADNCDPIFIPQIFYNLKIRQLKNAGNKNGISFFRALETFSSPQLQTYMLQIAGLGRSFP